MVEKKKKETVFNVTVRYRDNGVDTFYGIKSTRILNNTLEMVESNSMTVHIVLDVVTHIRIEEVSK